MPNQLLTAAWITRESARSLENSTIFVSRVQRKYADEWKTAGAKIGNTTNIRKPPRYTVRYGQALNLQDAIETSVPLVLNNQIGVDTAFTSADFTLSIEDFRKRFIDPNIIKVANECDRVALQQFLNVANIVGTPGTIPNQLLTYLDAGALMENEACPQDNNRHLLITPMQRAYIVDALKGLFQDSTLIGKQYRTGTIGVGSGFNWGVDQNMWTQTIGTQGGSGLINGASQTGSSIVTNGWTHSVTGLLNQGDRVYFAGCYGVNPQNYQTFTGPLASTWLREWVVTASVNSDGSGNATIPISGPSGLGIVTSGPFQNCSASPTNAGAVTVIGASGVLSQMGMGFHEDAFAFATADLELPGPGGVEMAERVADDEEGISIRLVKAYDINQDRSPVRTDLLFGSTTVYPELACMIAS